MEQLNKLERREWGLLGLAGAVAFIVIIAVAFRSYQQPSEPNGIDLVVEEPNEPNEPGIVVRIQTPEEAALVNQVLVNHVRDLNEPNDAWRVESQVELTGSYDHIDVNYAQRAERGFIDE